MEPIRVSRTGTYTPSWGNEDREGGEKIIVHFRHLSFAEQQSLIYMDDVGKTLAYDSRVMAMMVTEIENLSVIDENEDEKKIKSGKDLVHEPGVEELCLELWVHFRNITAVDKKKLPLE